MVKTRTGWFRMSFHRAGRMSAWHWSYGNARSQPKSNAITPGGSYPVAACGYMAWYADSRPEWAQDLPDPDLLPGKACSKCVNR